MKRIRDPQYLKLIKKEPNGVRYWEAWVHAPKIIVVHEGMVGDMGQQDHHVDQFWHSPQNEIEKLAKPYREAGYIPLTMKNLHWFLVQYDITGLSNRQLIVKRKKVQQLLDQLLGWTGNGRCKGSNVFENVLNFYCLAVIPKLAVKSIIEQFRKDKLIDGLVMGIKEGNDYLQVYPEESKNVLKSESNIE